MDELSRVAIVGAGRMGRGIAQSCALAGVPALLIDLKPRSPADAAALQAAVHVELMRDLDFLVNAGLLERARVAAIASLVDVRPAAEVGASLQSYELVFEGVPETLAAKQEALQWVAGHARSDAIIASTTSTMDVNQLAQLTQGPERFLNAHWLNPAHLMPLVELSVGAKTDPGVTARIRGMLKALGKITVVCGASPGYIVPRIQALAMNEAARLVEEGAATPEDIDTAVRVGFGLRFAILGLLEFIDWGGNDILYYASGHLSSTIDAARYRPPDIVEHNMRQGRNGLRDGLGFYDYTGMDVQAYRDKKLSQFVGLIGHLGLLPPGLKAAGKPSDVA